ncbi:MAG: YggS family pyridoxal phosphate-dependent enzyme [Thermoguttaceae bacterium]|jgi:pyridoxal phosphate enzyme (YggS family)
MEQNRWDELRRETADKLRRVHERIAEAATRSGRTPESVKLVTVTKYVTGAEGMEAALFDAGCVEFGESRVARLLKKWAFLNEASQKSDGEIPYPDPRLIKWHFIGPLQRNKVRRLLPYVSLIHSIDTLELFKTIVRIMREENDPTTRSFPREESILPFPKKIPVLLEVNISGEENKHGFQPESFLEQVAPCFEKRERVEIRGLMGMGGLASTPDEVRRQFARLRLLFDEARHAFPDANLTELSMGMSDDFEIAVEEGATIVRIGSILF